MGVEPTGAGFADAHTVLKTGEATGPLPPPWRRFLVAVGDASLAQGSRQSCQTHPLENPFEVDAPLAILLPSGGMSRFAQIWKISLDLTRSSPASRG
jgi:hypothetical protein